MNDAASITSSTPPTPTWTRWLSPALAITGIAVGIFIIVAGIYLVFWQPSGCNHMMKAGPPATQSMDCCASMMKGMKMPMEDKPGMSSMPGMPSTPNMPAPAPGR
ncbi:hypothetical protein [Mycobacterium colombiense]|uniref:hypothetical protein n=1 Tax=Mycobacterium colombiense TaxID=339268 RepID=UPI000AC87C77|nr:hypothetical protein [Mycobacterium colombiense]